MLGLLSYIFLQLDQHQHKVLSRHVGCHRFGCLRMHQTAHFGNDQRGQIQHERVRMVQHAEQGRINDVRMFAEKAVGMLRIQLQQVLDDDQRRFQIRAGHLGHHILDHIRYLWVVALHENRPFRRVGQLVEALDVAVIERLRSKRTVIR